MTLFSI